MYPYQQSNVNWVYVNGVEGARNQIVQPGQTAWMMDNNEPMIYVKAVDGMGSCSLRTFRLEEVRQEERQKDLEERIRVLEELIGGMK